MATTTSLSDGEDSTASDVERDLLQNVMAMSLQPDTSHISTASDEIHKQTGGTCYANAVATVLRAAESRIVGRKLVSHADVVRQLVDRWGSKGRSSELVLSVECPIRTLRFQQRTSVQQVDDAVRKNRTLLVRFWLDDNQWHRFSEFFKKTPKGVLSKQTVGAQESGQKTEGHAMVIRGTSTDYWILKNSWGDWADAGYCRVAKNAFAWKIYDVFYLQSDLTEQDWANYRRYDSDKCNARAMAMVIRAAADRIIGRKTKPLKKLKKEILRELQKEKNAMTILRAECSRRRLRVRKLVKSEEEEEGTVVSEKRPLLGMVELSEANWNKFVRVCIDDEVDCAELRDDEWMNVETIKKSCYLVIVAIVGTQYQVKNPWLDGNGIRSKYKYLDLVKMDVNRYDVYYFQHELFAWDWTNYYESQKLQLEEHLQNQTLQK